jgi:hypothetical protein
MDPVAAQFLSQLDAAEEELPKTVVSGLLMCGEDAAPGLRERVRGEEWPLPTRCFSAYVLAQLGVDDVYPAIIDAFLGGDPVLMSVLGPILVDGGTEAGKVLLARALDPLLVPEARAVLGGMAAQAGVQDPALESLAIELLPLAPEDALHLMAMVPSPSYATALREHSELLREAPELAFDVLAATLGGEAEAKATAMALEDALAGFVHDVLDPLTARDPDQP